jgi:hypothetical protein
MLEDGRRVLHSRSGRIARPSARVVERNGGANLVGRRSKRNERRRPQPIVISVGIVLLAAVVLVSAGLLAVPLWAILVQGWRFESIADECKMLNDDGAREACDERVRGQ